MLIDTKHDHNAKGTPRRWAKMFINELYRGRYYPAPVITEFPNVNKVDELYVVGPIVLRSACAHHMAPIMGQVWVGVLAKDTLIGLSKFHRIIEHIAARPQIQEELTTQIADALEELTAPEGIAVLQGSSSVLLPSWG
jgi:GTP cyclohydrolase I